MHVTFAEYEGFSRPLEGRVPTMYADCLGLITVGVGNLINTLPQALALSWLLEDGRMADQADVAADWHKLHDNAQYYAARKWTVYAKTMRCHLSDASIDALIQRQLDLNEAIISKRFPAWDSFPADAQLAIMSLAWAVGAAFYVKFTNLAKYIDAQDWGGCVASCKIREENNPGVVPRNARNRFCFHNAALVKAENLSRTVLHWPGIVPAFNADASEAAAAKVEAEIQQAAWHALELCPVVPGSGRALLDYESAPDATPEPRS